MYNRAAERIIRDLRQWSSTAAGRRAAELDWQPDGDAACSLETLLRARVDWLDCPDPTLWRSGDVHRLLIEVTAARLNDFQRLTELAPVVLGVLFDFLDGTDRFHPACLRVAALRKELNRAAARFPAAMADESVWRLAKRVFRAIVADGVDPEDGAAVDAWAAEFSTAPPERRRAVLGVLLDRQPELMTAQFAIVDSQVAAIVPGVPIPQDYRRHDPDNCERCREAPVNPPVALLAMSELAAAVRASALVRNMVACGRWASGGRPVTKHGFPQPADTRSLAAALGVTVRDSVRDPRGHIGLVRAWRLALDAEVLQLHRTAVVAGPGLAALERALSHTADPDHTVRVWKDIADLAVTGPARLPTRDNLAAQLDEFARPWGPRALGELYRSAGGAEVEDLVGTLITNYHGPRPDEMLAMVAGAVVRSSLLAATEAGVVTVTVPADASIDPDLATAVDATGNILGDPAWVVSPVPGTRAELTPLGQYFVWQNLVTEGAHAPLLEPAR